MTDESDGTSEHEIRFSDGMIVNGQIVETNIRMIKQSDILKCPFVIMVASHYREDGTCKCNDPDEQQHMIKEWGYKPQHFIKINQR